MHAQHLPLVHNISQQVSYTIHYLFCEKNNFRIRWIEFIVTGNSETQGETLRGREDIQGCFSCESSKGCMFWMPACPMSIECISDTMCGKYFDIQLFPSCSIASSCQHICSANHLPLHYVTATSPRLHRQRLYCCSAWRCGVKKF